MNWKTFEISYGKMAIPKI